MARRREGIGAGVDRDRLLDARRTKGLGAGLAGEHRSRRIAIGHQAVGAKVRGAATRKVDLATGFGANVVLTEGAEEGHQLGVAVVLDQAAGTTEVDLGVGVNHHRTDGAVDRTATAINDDATTGITN